MIIFKKPEIYWIKEIVARRKEPDGIVILEPKILDYRHFPSWQFLAWSIACVQLTTQMQIFVWIT